MFSFLSKNILSSEDINECPDVLFFGNLNSENMSNDAYQKILVLAQTTANRRDDLFFALHLILGEKLDLSGRDGLQRTCPLRSENVATLGKPS